MDNPPTDADADKFRILQAEELLKTLGFVVGPDGKWHGRQVTYEREPQDDAQTD